MAKKNKSSKKKTQSNIPKKDIPKRDKTVKTLSKILDENPAEIVGERAVAVEADEEVSAKKSSEKRGIFAILGFFLTVFAVIGLINSSVFAFRFMSDFINGKSMKNELTEIIYPAVLIDVTEFQDISLLSSDQIIAASIWSMLMKPDEMKKYEESMGIISVPANDVEEYAQKLFGNNLPQISHSNVGAGDLTFFYNNNIRTYNVPTNPIMFTYVPDITSIKRDNDIFTLEVDYIVETPNWIKQGKDYQEEIAKTAEFKLQKNDDSYIILSMEILSGNSI